MSEEFIEETPAGRRPYARTLFALQALLIVCVTGWVLEIGRAHV